LFREALRASGGLTVRIVSHHYATLEEALAAEMPPMSSVVIGSSVSPTGRYAAALRLVPSAGGYLADELYERDESGWTSYGGGSGGGISWSSLVDVSTGRASDGNLGVLRYGEEAPPGATSVRIEYEGEHTVPVVHGHFLFVAWDTEFATDPRVVEFITD
jgi:hypothetical protein